MARTYGRVLCSIWDDDDFLALSSDAKVLYLAFTSQPDTTAAGVLPVTPRRWRKWLNDNTSSTDTALDELIRTRFVLIDDDTAEVCIRTFIRHDGRLDNPKMVTSIRNAIDKIRSAAIREACYRLLGDLTENPQVDRRSIPDGSPFDPGSILPSSQAAFHPFNQAAAAASPDVFTMADVAPAAAAAIDLLVEHKVATEAKRSPNGMRIKLQRDLPAEHGPALHAYLTEHPEANAAELARRVLGLSELDLHRLAKESA